MIADSTIIGIAMVYAIILALITALRPILVNLIADFSFALACMLFSFLLYISH